MNTSITIDLRDEVLTAAISGKIDGQSAPGLQTQLISELGASHSAVLDVQNVPYMSSAGFRMLLLLHREITSRNGRTAMVGLCDEVRDTMEMTGFLDFFLLFDSVEEALQQVCDDATSDAATR